MRTSTFVVLLLVLSGLLLTLIFRAPSGHQAISPASSPGAAALPAATGLANVSRELRFCADYWPPYSDHVGTTREGYVVELVRAIFEPLGYRVSYSLEPWGRCLAGVRSGRFTGLAGAEYGDVPDLIFPRQLAGGSIPTFFTRPESRWTFLGEASLRRIRLGVVQNYTYAPGLDRYIESALESERILVLRGEEPLKQMMTALHSGRIDAFVENSVVVYEFLRQQQLPVEQLRVAGTAGAAKGVFVPFSPADARAAELSSLFDRRLSELRQNGELQRILKRYDVADWQNSVSGRGY